MSSDSDQLSQLRLLQFLSPAAPVGSYSYSQGLEWAVNEGWITDEASFRQWVEEQIGSTLCMQELPLLSRLHHAVLNKDIAAVEYWSQFAVAVRDTAELRQEERQRAEAYFRILKTVQAPGESWSSELFLFTPLTSIAWFSVEHDISAKSLLTAFAHNWLESSLVTGMKTIPLGQSAGQQLLFELAPTLVKATERSSLVCDEQIGVSLPALSMASCGHEVQYSRVYRS